MNINNIEEKIMAGIDKSDTAMMFAQGYGRLLGFLWGTIERMSPEDQEKTQERLEEFAEFWSERIKNVEKSTIYQ